MSVDSNRYPITARYLAKLPKGLDSYPDCKVRTNAHEGLREAFPKIAEDRYLPELVRSFFRGSYREDWMPEVMGSTLVHLIRDVGFKTDDDYSAWSFENNTKLFKTPFYRVIMYLFSTTLLINGAGKRWGTMHQGSTMEATPVAKEGSLFSANSILTFPPYVFDELDMRNIKAGYLAALIASRAVGPQVTAANLSGDKAEIRMTWQA